MPETSLAQAYSRKEHTLHVISLYHKPTQNLAYDTEPVNVSNFAPCEYQMIVRGCVV